LTWGSYWTTPRFEKRGYKLVALKLVQSTKEHLEQHYADLSSKPFFNGLVKYMASGPVVAMVWEGKVRPVRVPSKRNT
jgi:nucleoside-diphosphate kinase